MGWSYRKRIKIIPGVYLNLSKSGISTSIGVKGANVTFSREGTYLNTGISGTGIYNRSKISFEGENNQTPIPFDSLSNDLPNNIFSAEIYSITSEGMEGIKEAIIVAQEQRKDLQNDLSQINSSLNNSKLKLTLSYIFLYGLINKAISKKIKADIQAKKEAIVQLEEQIENCYLGIDVNFDSNIHDKYKTVVESFKNLCKSVKIWDVTASIFQDTKITRTSTSTLVVKKGVRFGIKTIPDIKSKFEPLWLHNINGADLFIYPSFVVMYSSASKFALVEIDKIDLQHRSIRFVETEAIPSDTKIIDKTWAKVNGNGTPDRRFKNNYQIPVVQYGEIILQSKTGIKEAYYISNYEYSSDFANAFHDFQKAMKPLKANDIYNPVKSVSVDLEPKKVAERFAIEKKLPVNSSEVLKTIPDILQTEASVITESGKEYGKITKLSGAIGGREIKLYLALEEWKHFPIDLLPTIAITFKVDAKSNFLIINSSHKDISPLKKGDTFTIYFDDNSFIEKQFIIGRTLSGKVVTNIIVLSDLELIQLSQVLINNIVTESAIKMPYQFIDVSNSQYSSTVEGKKLFKIICERIIGVKELLLKKNGENDPDFPTDSKPLLF